VSEHYVDEEPGEYSVGDVMSTPLFKALPTMTVKEATIEMLKRRIGSVVVVNENDSLLGIVTRTDIIREVVAKGRDPETLTLGDIMTRNPYYVFTDDPLEKAAEIMGEYGIGHLPVLDP
jgi:CBS domain-containing protein